ncbi:Hypothetical protein R9X50_00608200 [Acrodontium crateriforme]|uniref:Uncharacterized protein n=1 Tax=Acrodontium crateriforme TaxID=150365 RepID=A0AAQ3M8F3_9PEZI|nr:Hypothetical protein R9X50_00608200 [Acrodontium crateriforme]
MEKVSLSKTIAALHHENGQLQVQRINAVKATSKWHERYAGARDKFLGARGTIEQCVTKLVEQQATINAFQMDLPLKIVDRENMIRQLHIVISRLGDGFRAAKEDGNAWRKVCEDEKGVREDLLRDLRCLNRHRSVDRAIISALKFYRLKFFNRFPERLAKLVEELHSVENDIDQQKETEAKLRAQIAVLERGVQDYAKGLPLKAISGEA